VSVLHLNHFDLDRLGVATGDVVGVTGTRGSVRLPVALDDEVPRGVTEIAFASLDADGDEVVRPILDQGDVISQVRLESA
jgi:anaerobic selenocysteine-containing dehydrogenase